MGVLCSKHPMTTLGKIRIYHAALAILCLAAFASGEIGLIHNWIGYGVALILLFRLLWAFTGPAQLGLMRFYPSFEGLTTDNWLQHPAISRSLLAGILLTAIVATGTGIALDRGQSFSSLQSEMQPSLSRDSNHEAKSKKDEDSEDMMEEIHEAFSHLMLLLVAMHVTYLLAFKRPLARFMLFLPGSDAKKA